MTRYATLPAAEDQFSNISGASADAALLWKQLTPASRLVEEFCGGRRFDWRIETRRYDAVGLHVGVDHIDLDEDLLELTALVNGDGSAVDLACCTLAPYNAYPKRSIYLNGVTWARPANPRAAIQVAGAWGFHRRPDEAWQDANVTVPAGGLAEDAVELVLPDLGAIERGHVLKIEDEQVSVEEIVSGPPHTLTVTRGLNGTEPAAHAEGAGISYFAPEPTVARATARAAAWLYKLRDAAMEKRITPMGEVVVPAGFPADIHQTLRRGGFVRKRETSGIYAA
jgi:hypothetical protein